MAKRGKSLQITAFWENNNCDKGAFCLPRQYLLMMAISFGVSFAVTWIFWKPEQAAKEEA